MIEFKLRQSLAKTKKTMADINKETGISKNALSQLANGSSKGIQFKTLNKILGCLKIPVQELIVYTPDSITGIRFIFDYDETPNITVSFSESTYGNSDEDSINYVSEISFGLPNFRVTAEFDDVILAIPCEINVSYSIDNDKELSGLDIDFKKNEIVNELVVPSVFSGDYFEESLIDYIINLAENLFPDEIENVGSLLINADFN
ncbi:helix-turn-helix domain-containing protein [Enterococcus sp. LJL120]